MYFVYEVEKGCFRITARLIDLPLANSNEVPDSVLFGMSRDILIFA
jgi:hypothetical protein